jgi:hypothetical protein
MVGKAVFALEALLALRHFDSEGAEAREGLEEPGLETRYSFDMTYIGASDARSGKFWAAQWAGGLPPEEGEPFSLDF